MSSKDAAAAAKSSGKPEDTKDPKTVKKMLEEDDEFEDFPAEEWEEDETEVPPGSGKANLWEESWDDDDLSEDFSKQLKEELKKVEAQKASGEMQR
ncbi:putative 26S proteasome complex subunit sem-1 [Drechslerella dactyloides]|uniref:26S proteasome complex subunit SEM1 n=1 Tax=Drechslerella dactyloides TaxID=74499 RepID=A0AAD6IZA1_DREDA|nr:putative 26S proteasome complex subunit sem-1 [Drechslerella dactyloides]